MNLFSIYFQKIKAFVILHKKTILLLSPLFILLLLSLSLLLVSESKKTQEKEKASTANINKGSEQTKKYNPLINNKEIEKIEKAYAEKFKKSNKEFVPPPRYKFKYQMKDSPQSVLDVKKAYAAECNYQNLPDMLSVLTFTFHLFLNDAKAIAMDFNFKGDPSSLPTDDGSSFQYYFTDASASAFLTVYEPSGMYIYHKAIKQPEEGSDLSLSQAFAIADETLKAHGLSSNLKKVSEEWNEATGTYIFVYNKDYSSLDVVDKNSVNALAGSKDPCSVSPSTDLNRIEIMITKKGNLFKLINKTRKVDSSYTFSKLSLDEAFEEYKDNPPVDPIVVGNTPIDDTVTLDTTKTQVVYFDYGEDYAQISYVPLYLTVGQSQSGATVYTFFPAISKSDLDKTNINQLSKSQDTLQLGTFRPQAPKPSQKPRQTTVIPTYSGENFYTGSSGCFGGFVDHIVSCTDTSLNKVCNIMVQLKASDDVYGVCESGCKTISETLSYDAFVKPCEEFFKKTINKPIPPGGPYNLSGYGTGKTVPFQGGEVNCKVQICPC